MILIILFIINHLALKMLFDSEIIKRAQSQFRVEKKPSNIGL
jgi:hypothetical protein